MGLFADPGQVMGHEFAGGVVEVGSDVDGIAVGDRDRRRHIRPMGSDASTSVRWGLAPKFPSAGRKVPVSTSARVANLDRVR